MALTPTTSAFAATRTQRERIIEIRNSISELRLQLNELVPVGQLMLRSIHAEDRIRRMNDQKRAVSRALELLNDGRQFSDRQFDTLFGFLQMQIDIAAQNLTKLYQKVRMTKMENVGNTGEKVFQSLPVNSDLNQEAAIPIATAFVTKTKALTCAYEEQILLANETKKMLERKELEEHLYVNLAAETDAAIDELKARTKESRKQLDSLTKEVRRCEKEDLQVSKDISFKMGKLKRAAFHIREKAGDDKFLKSVVSLLNMLQSPSETEEQIRICFDSIVAMARLNASSEQTRQAVPLRPVRKQTVEDTLAELKARIAARKPNL